MSRIVQVGLVGYGFSGKTFHAPVVSAVPGLRLTSVVQRKGDSARERYPDARIVRSTEELYNDPEIELVIITTPSGDHVRFVQQALEAGKHVVVEKPFTVTTAEADQLIALAKEKGKVLSVFHNRRWDGDFLTIKKLLDQRWLGDLVEFEARWDRYQPAASGWRDQSGPGAGTLYDLGVHLIDQALCLFGLPQRVTGKVRQLRKDSGAVDYFQVHLQYAQFSVNIGSSKIAREPAPRYTIHGTAGSFVKYGIDPQEAALIAGDVPRNNKWGREPESEWGLLNTDKDGLHFTGKIETEAGSYGDYYANIRDAIVHGSELAVKAEEARNAVRIVELAMISHEQGKTVDFTL